MAKKVQSVTKNGTPQTKNGQPESLKLWRNGIHDSYEFLNALTTTISDLAATRLTPHTGNAMFAGSRSVLKMLELQVKHGKPEGNNGSKVLHIGQ